MSHTGWSWLSCCLTLALAPAEPFLDLSYEQALARSREEGRLLIVVATSNSSPRCQLVLERELAPLEPARNWLAQNALAIRIDVDVQGELARSLEIETTPTLIAIKNGVEFDRVSGESAADWSGWLFAADAAWSCIDRCPDRSRLVSGSDVDAHVGLARDLLRQHDIAASLEHYVWLWDHLRYVEWRRGELVAALASEIRTLCEADEAAREAFVEMREELGVTALSIVDGSRSRPILGADVVNSVLQRNVTWRLSRLHAAALSLGEPSDAVFIGRLLISHYDDRDSRLALVRAAFAAGRTCPEHIAWLEEADRMGAHNAVAALRAKRAALAAADASPPSDTR